MGGLFSLVGSLVSLPFQISGQQRAQQAAEGEAAASASIATFKMQQQANQYALFRTLEHRQNLQALRQGQQAQAQGFGAGVGQVGSGYGFSSAAGGARGQTGGETATAVSGISENIDYASKNLALTQQITSQQIMMAQFGQQMAEAQGTMIMGKDIGQMVSAFGGIFGPGGGPVVGSNEGGGYPFNIGFGMPVGA